MSKTSSRTRAGGPDKTGISDVFTPFHSRMGGDQAWLFDHAVRYCTQRANFALAYTRLISSFGNADIALKALLAIRQTRPTKVQLGVESDYDPEQMPASCYQWIDLRSEAAANMRILFIALVSFLECARGVVYLEDSMSALPKLMAQQFFYWGQQLQEWCKKVMWNVNNLNKAEVRACSIDPASYWDKGRRLSRLVTDFKAGLEELLRDFEHVSLAEAGMGETSSDGRNRPSEGNLEGPCYQRDSRRNRVSKLLRDFKACRNHNPQRKKGE